MKLDGLAKNSKYRLHSTEIQRVITFPPSVAVLFGVSQIAQTSSSLAGSLIAFATCDTDKLDGLATSSIRGLLSTEIQRVIVSPLSVAVLLGVSPIAQTSSSLLGGLIAFAICDTDKLIHFLKGTTLLYEKLIFQVVPGKRKLVKIFKLLE